MSFQPRHRGLFSSTNRQSPSTNRVAPRQAAVFPVTNDRFDGVRDVADPFPWTVRPSAQAQFSGYDAMTRAACQRFSPLTS
ncbi:MAG: hypothetical protein QOD88_1970 [Mycobacterium sp.]|jgi:hypothetical protein|nr:hypothetical protein [Mycobacterium sp.]